MLELSLPHRPNLYERREKPFLPPDGEMHSTQDDVCCVFPRLYRLSPGDKIKTHVPIGNNPALRQLITYDRLGISFRSKFAQAGGDGDITDIEDDQIVVEIVNRGEHTLVFEPDIHFALGKVYSMGRPLQGAELDKLVKTIQAQDPVKVVEEEGLQLIEIPLKTRYASRDGRVLFVHNLPRGTIRGELHDALGWVRRPFTEEDAHYHVTQFAETGHVRLSSQYCLLISHGKNNDMRIRHGKSQLIYGDNTNHPIISECHGLATTILFAGYKDVRI